MMYSLTISGNKRDKFIRYIIKCSDEVKIFARACYCDPNFKEKISWDSTGRFYYSNGNRFGKYCDLKRYPDYSIFLKNVKHIYPIIIFFKPNLQTQCLLKLKGYPLTSKLVCKQSIFKFFGEARKNYFPLCNLKENWYYTLKELENNKDTHIDITNKFIKEEDDKE